MNKKLSICITADGSNTLFHAGIGESYHSQNGALQEAGHVYVQNGLAHYYALHQPPSISILEVGFGTGLNFLVSAGFAIQNKLSLTYTGIEPFPPSGAILEQLGFESIGHNRGLWGLIKSNYSKAIASEHGIELVQGVKLKINACSLADFEAKPDFDILYYDAFAPAYQPEMWERDAIVKAASLLKPGGMFITYSITGNLKRMLKNLGFRIEKPAGAAGKREMMRGVSALT